MSPRLVAFASLVFLCGAVRPALPQQPESGFPYSAWLEHKQVTQIPWFFSVGKPNTRSDLRRELRLAVSIKPPDLERNGSKPDLELFARALENGKVITPVYSVTPAEAPPIPMLVLRENTARAAFLSLVAIVSPGKYKLELALRDRATGRYNTRYEDVTVDGNPNEPLEQALRRSNKFEFVPLATRELRDEFPLALLPGLPIGFPSTIGLARGNVSLFAAGLMPRGTDLGALTDSPRFVVEDRGTTHLSVITILSPPDRALGNANALSQFHGKLMSLLSVFVRLDMVRGTAQLTGVDLTDRIRVFDLVDMKAVSPDLLRSAIFKNTNTIKLESLAGQADSGRFFRDVLRDRFEEAENDGSGANRVIVVVGARQSFPRGPAVTPLSPARDCHCRVFYVRFALIPNESDDVDRLLKPYRPRVFDPLNWEELREDFGRIYEELLR